MKELLERVYFVMNVTLLSIIQHWYVKRNVPQPQKTALIAHLSNETALSQLHFNPIACIIL